MSKNIDIISVFRKDYDSSWAGREIARRSKMNHQTALNHLKNMEKLRIVKSVSKGRNKEYSISGSFQAKAMIEICEISRSLDADKELLILIEDLLAYTESIIVFGSFASETHEKESDIDLIILGKADKKKISRAREIHPRDVNIEYISYNDLAKSLKQKKPLALEILKNHLLYGDVSRIVDIFWKWYKR